MLSAARWTLWCAAYFCMFVTVVCHQQEEPKGMQIDRIVMKSDANSHETKATETRRRLSSAKEAVAPLQKPGRFLMGIFTISKERERRDLIRKALAMYQDSRICSLGSTDGNLPTAPADGCELIYTFVFGANPEGPTQVLGNSSLPVITKPPADFDASLEPNDITFLNIKVRLHTRAHCRHDESGPHPEFITGHLIVTLRKTWKMARPRLGFTSLLRS